MAEREYWFARRFPVGSPRNGMSPVSPEGFGVVRAFVGWMTGGAIGAVVLVLLGLYLNQWWLYIVAALVYIGCTAYGGWYFISIATKRGDHQHTVDDYRSGRVQ